MSTMKWQLFICACGSHARANLSNLFVVEVDPQVCTVADLKELIHKRNPESAPKLQSLYHEEQLLANSTLLASIPNMKDGSSVTLVAVSSSLHLKIRDVARQTSTSITITDPQNAAFSRLAKLVEVATGVSASQQKLFYQGNLLREFRSIPDGSTLSLVRLTTWELLVQYCEPGTCTKVEFVVTVPNPQSTSLLFLKKLIEKKTDLLPRKQALYSPTCNPAEPFTRAVLDSYPLCESPLRDGDTVKVQRFSGWHLHIKMMDGSTTMVTVDDPEKMTIVGLKELIARSTKVPEAEQRLMSTDHDILEDVWFDENNKVHQKRLKLYPQIGDESVVHLVRLTGKGLRLMVGPPTYLDGRLHFESSIRCYFAVPKEVQNIGQLKSALDQMWKYLILLGILVETAAVAVRIIVFKVMKTIQRL